jgi:hypothetical protein
MFGQKSGIYGKGAGVKSREGSDANQAAQTNDSAPSAAPSISLPKGGGAIRGMGEKFAADPISGAGCVALNMLGHKNTEHHFSSGGSIEEICHESNLSAKATPIRRNPVSRQPAESGLTSVVGFYCRRDGLPLMGRYARL